MHLVTRCSTALLFTICLASTALHAQPVNDQCGGALVIPPAGPFPHLTAVTNIAAAGTTGDPGTPSCQTYVSRSVWYAFRPAITASYTIATCAALGAATTLDDNVMALFASANGCAGPFFPLAGGCNDDGCGGGSYHATLTRRLSSDTTYYILVWKYGVTAPAASRADLQLRIERNDPPANDRCTGAQPLVLDVPVRGTTAWAADDYRLSGQLCFTGLQQMASPAAGGDVVYTFRAPAAGLYSFKASHFTLQSDLVLYVASSCAAGSAPALVGTCLGASNRSSSSSSEEVLCVALAADQLVYAFVDEHGPSAGGDFFIEVNRCVREIEPNNTPATAQALAQGIAGAVYPSGEADIYALGSLPAGARIFALVDGSAGNRTDFDLRVTTATDVLEYDDADNDTPYGSNAANVAGTPAPGGPVYLRVTQYSAGHFSEPYRLYSVVQPPSTAAALETEPNDVPAAASHASANYFRGTLAGPAPSTDVDWYGFAADAGDLLMLSLDADPLRDGTPVNVALSLHAADGTELVAVNDGKATSSTASGAGSLTATTPNAPAEAIVLRAPAGGTYYVRVRSGSTTTGAAGAGDYLLSISRNGAIGGGGLPTDLAVVTSVSRDTIISATTVVQRIVVRNLGNGAASAIVLRDSIAQHLGYVSHVAGSGWTITAPAPGQSGVLSGVLAWLGTGDSAVVLVTLRADAAVPHGAQLPLCVAVSAPSTDPVAANNTACVLLRAENRTPRIDAAGSLVLLKVGCSDSKLGRSYTQRFAIGNASSVWNVGAMEWSAVAAGPNIRLLAGAGMEGDTLVYAVDTKGLAIGSHTRSIIISARNALTGAPAENSPFTLTVRIELEPVGGIMVTRTQAVGTGGFTQFVNALGQVYAEVRSNTVPLDSVTVAVHPCSLHNGFDRRAWVYRWFEVSSPAPAVDLDIRFYYARTELEMFALGDPSAIRAFRQQPALGPWYEPASSSEPLTGSVLVRNATVLGDVWALAAPSWTSVSPLRGVEGGEVQESPADGAMLDVPHVDAAQAFTLSQNAPNPIVLSRGGEATIDFTLAETGSVLLTLHDMLGRTVRTLVDGERGRGAHRAALSAAGLPPGAYVYRLAAAGRLLTRTLLIMQ